MAREPREPRRRNNGALGFHMVRFEATYHALRECLQHIEDAQLSRTEHRYRARMVMLCTAIHEEYSHLGDLEEPP